MNALALRPSLASEMETLPVFGTTVEVLFDAESTGGQYTLYRCTVPPAGGPPPHRHDFDEAFYVVAGELEILCGTETYRAHEGTRVFAPRGMAHTFRNAAEVPAVYIGIATPGGHEEFFKDAASIAGPLDPPTAIALCERNGIELLF